MSELQMKEVVLMSSGKKLGFIEDLEIDESNGLISSLIILSRGSRTSFFNKPSELIVEWKQIETIGADIILVKDLKKEL